MLRCVRTLCDLDVRCEEFEAASEMEEVDLGGRINVGPDKARNRTIETIYNNMLSTNQQRWWFRYDCPEITAQAIY